MPSCFQLLRDGIAVPLNDVDEEMCRHFEAECHPHYYFEEWFLLIGRDLASGASFDDIRASYADRPILVSIASWLEGNFTVRSWYERGRRST